MVADIRAINKRHRQDAVNRQLQAFLFAAVHDANEAAVKRALAVLIELYRRNVWTDERSVNVIATAAHHKSPRVSVAALNFFMGVGMGGDGEDSDDEDDDPEPDFLNIWSGDGGPRGHGTTSGGLPPANGPEKEAAFPTEQRLRQKARAKAGHVAKKRPQVVEDHHDDCGEDFGPLGDDPYFQDTPEEQADSDDEISLPSWDFGLNGSEWTAESYDDHGVTSPVMTFDSLEAFNEWNESTHGKSGASVLAYHDVAEICGGAGDTGTLLVRRGYVKGPNFDIVVGYDLSKESMVRGLLRYVAAAKPVVLIISTPCTGMKGFSALNRSLNPAAWRRSRKVSVPLAKLAALVALRQMSEGRHFIAEHPQGSDMWSLPEWVQLDQRFPVHKVDVHQCMLGLRGPRTGHRIKKPTTFWASDARLIARLQGIRCDQSASNSLQHHTVELHHDG